MTLGNRKAIDIVVEAPDRTITIDVKGMASRTNWPLDNFDSSERANHYIALVSFNNKIADHTVVPTVYLVPAGEIPKYFYTNPKKTRRTIQFSKMRNEGKEFLEAWDSLSLPAKPVNAQKRRARLNE